MSVTDYELQGLGQSAKNAFRAVQDGDLATLKRFLGSTRLVATLVSKFTRIPADNIPLVVDFWAHVGFY